MKIKSILVKSIAVAAMSVTGLVVANNAGSNTAQAAIVQNDASVVTVNYVSNNSINVYNNYENPVATGQTLASNTSWKVIKTAYDSKGHKWYDLGKNQWVRAKYVTIGHHAAATQTTNTAAQTSAQSQIQTTSNTSASSYTSSATGSEASAKAWIASRESGGSYSASNGQYVGKYQLSASYLNGDYSAANQERVADNYVKSRYGSWTAAKAFWQANGWY
ncbi:peptidoglycan-binding protein [Lactobacillus amylovorus subsp. amylovorus]|uniref:aggregation-promoting factor n=1 Tax=Lactobacillus amylovorus TaxID=1604 RepID=UPI00283D903A|nr:peptidoglycan-binding protein [Lactobacillus amylovorus]